MHYFIIIFVSLIVKNVVSEVNNTCDSAVETDWEYQKIEYGQFCSGAKPCVVKCCGKDEAIYYRRSGSGITLPCEKIINLKKKFHDDLSKIPFSFSDFNIYNTNGYKSEKTSKNLLTDFNLVHSNLYKNKDCYTIVKMAGSKLLILENGDLVKPLPNHYDNWHSIKSPNYCVDMVIGQNKKNEIIHKYLVMLPNIEEGTMTAKALFTASAMLVSSFFLMLILFVYGVLHQLRNMKGLLLVAYVASIMAAYILKGAMVFRTYYERVNSLAATDCTIITQITYFFFLATFFWMNVMSFDLWWTFRGSRKLREIHRRGINVKFLVYSAYAFGIPALMTIFAVIMDKQNLPPHIVKPFFDQCLMVDSTFVYLYVPMIILIVCNCLLFVMTVYNIWLIRHRMSDFDKKAARNNAHNQNRFWLYMRLGCWMGIGWITEVSMSRVPKSDVPVWLEVLLSAYNMLTGLVIFIMFICKKKIFVMLCNRFNIENRWTRDGRKKSSNSRSDTKSVKSYSRSTSRTKCTVDSGVEVRIPRIESIKSNAR